MFTRFRNRKDLVLHLHLSRRLSDDVMHFNFNTIQFYKNASFGLSETLIWLIQSTFFSYQNELCLHVHGFI